MEIPQHRVGASSAICGRSQRERECVWGGQFLTVVTVCPTGGSVRKGLFRSVSSRGGKRGWQQEPSCLGHVAAAIGEAELE